MNWLILANHNFNMNNEVIEAVRLYREGATVANIATSINARYPGVTLNKVKLMSAIGYLSNPVKSGKLRRVRKGLYCLGPVQEKIDAENEAEAQAEALDL